MTTQRRFPSLAHWYANPLNEAEAVVLLARATQQQPGGGSRRRSLLARRLQGVVARYWLGQPVEDELALLRSYARPSRRARLAIDLIEGQLLMSRRLARALALLEGVFDQGHHLLDAEGYLIVFRRLSLLRQIPLSPTALPPLTLHELEQLSRVISRLDGRRHTPRHDPNDTFG